MYFTYAEKKGALFTGWTTREVAFDCSRRYLYYSEEVKEDQVVPCSGPPIITAEVGAVNSRGAGSGSDEGSSPLANPLGFSSSVRLPTRSPIPFPTAPSAPHDPTLVTWKTKIKVDGISCAAHAQEFKIYDPYVKECDFYQMEILGEKRPMVKNEIPPPEPLLCPSSGLAGTPERFRLDNEEFIRDPLFLKELHEALLNTFVNLRLAREPNGITSGSSPRCGGTLSSPVGKYGRLSGIWSPKWVAQVASLLRFSSFSDLRRFLYVTTTVLSYDKLMPPPHMGYPPYDPRNGVVLSPLPLYLWRWYHELERQALYFCGPGSLLREINSEEGGKGFRGGHLCIVEKNLFFLHAPGEGRPSMYSLIDVRRLQRVCYSGRSSRQPCIIFLTETSGDSVFIPQRQRIGSSLKRVLSAKRYAPAALPRTNESVSEDRQWAIREVLHIVSIIRDLCLSSIETQPVIPVECIEASTVPEFLEEVKRRAGRSMRTDVKKRQCLKTSLELPAVWAAYRSVAAALRLLIREGSAQHGSQGEGATAAVPIYANNANHVPFTAEQVRELQAAVELGRHRRRGVFAGRFRGEGGIMGFTLDGSEPGGSSESSDRQAARSVSSGGVARSYCSTESLPSFAVPGAEYLTVGLPHGGGSSAFLTNVLY